MLQDCEIVNESISDLDESLLLVANCQSLRHLCRIKFREKVRAFKEFAQHLKHLPQQIKDYVLFKNVAFTTY